MTGDDYAKTAAAMWRDAQRLGSEDSKAYRNACYFAGYVVECTLKLLVEVDRAQKAPRIHDLQSLQDLAYRLSLTSNARCAKYGDPTRLAPTMLSQVSPPTVKKNSTQYHCHWDPLHRYDGARWDEICWGTYRNEAEAAFAVIQAMIDDGVIDP